MTKQATNPTLVEVRQGRLHARWARTSLAKGTRNMLWPEQYMYLHVTGGISPPRRPKPARRPVRGTAAVRGKAGAFPSLNIEKGELR